MDVIIICNKRDFFLAKVLVASIRYYYSDVKIFLVKDYLNGTFSTKIAEKYFNVNILDLGISHFGWGTAKIKLMISKQLTGRYLVLDADIVCIGDVMQKLKTSKAQFVVSPDYFDDAILNTPWFSRTYYDVNWVRDHIPDFSYPGYVFNTGQMVVSPGIVSDTSVHKYIQFDKYPYWTSFAEGRMPAADQSLFNIVFPRMLEMKDISMDTVKFKIWPRSEEAREISLKKIKESEYPYVLHWAGLKRVAAFQYMSHSDILFFFKKEYYKRLPFGQFRYYVDNVVQTIEYNTLEILRAAKRSIKK